MKKTVKRYNLSNIMKNAWAQEIKDGVIKALNLSLKLNKESENNYLSSIREKNLVDIEKVNEAKWFINLFLTAKENYKAEICFGNYMTKEELAEDYASLVSSKLMETF